MPEKAAIGLDNSHNNKLTMEASSYSDFTHFLFTSGYKLGKIQAGFNSLKKLETYNTIIISSPNNVKLTEEEINNLENFVKNGGGLLIVSSSGGDISNKTNLNEITRKFGFEFEPDEIQDSLNYVNLQKRPLLSKFRAHIVTEQLQKIVLSSACSIKVMDFLEDEKNIKIEVLTQGGLNFWRKFYDGDEWKEEDCPKKPLIVAIEYFKGKVIGYGSISSFSSLGREYGFTAFDNDILIANCLQWLTMGAFTGGRIINVSLNLDLFHWVNRIMKEDKWENISDIVNVSLKHLKDNYKEFLKEIKRISLEKKELKKKYLTKKEKKAREEDKILELVPGSERKKEDLEDIMSALEEVTGEKYELSIDFEKEEELEHETEELPGETEKEIEYTEEDIRRCEEETSKHALWHGKITKAFKEWLLEQNRSED